MVNIVAATSNFPKQYYPQEVLAGALRKYFLMAELDFDLDAIDRFFKNVQIDGRYFTFPLDGFYEPLGPGQTVEATIKASVNLAATTIDKLLADIDINTQEISQITSTTLTAAVPSLDARLMNEVPLSPHIKRNPLFGFGCMGGAAGLSRVADYLKGHPCDSALLFAVELSSALWQGSLQRDLYSMVKRLPDDPSQRGDILMTIVTAALFGDGAGAVLAVGSQHPLAQVGQPQIVETRSVWLPNTIDLMGMSIVDTGFRNILRPQVGEFVRMGLRKAIDPLLADYKLTTDKIAKWIVHPGGPKVIEAIEEEFSLSEDTLQLSRDTLKAIGNISSGTVLHMLAETLKQEPPIPGSYGLLIAMGPGFSQEVILLRW